MLSRRGNLIIMILPHQQVMNAITRRLNYISLHHCTSHRCMFLYVKDKATHIISLFVDVGDEEKVYGQYHASIFDQIRHQSWCLHFAS